MPLFKLNWGNIATSISADFIAFKAMADSYINPCTQEIYVSDNPRWHEAMNSSDRAGYWEAIKVEIATLVNLKVGTPVTRYECFGFYLGFQMLMIS